MNKLLIFLLLGCTICVFGCGAKSESESNTNSNPKVGAGSGIPGDQSKGDNVSTNAPVYDDPSKAPAAGGYRVEPSNPSDPKYKAAPGLGGGG